MKVYGKVTEHRAALFEAVSPYEMVVSNTTNENQQASKIAWAAATDELELYDKEAYVFDPSNPYAVIVKTAGVYDIAYTVRTYQYRTGTRHTPECTIWTTEPNGSPIRLFKTKTFSYLRNANTGQREAANTYAGPIKILKDNTRVELDIRVHRNNAVRIEENGAVLTFRKLRPLLDGEK